MLSIAIVLFIIMFPVLIPAAVSTVGAISDARKRKVQRVTLPAGNYANSVAR